MAQFARPSSDITNTSFTGTPVNTAGNLWQNVDESAANNSDFNYGANNTAAVYETSLSAVTNPNNTANHIIRYSVAKTKAGVVDGAGTAVNITVELYQGTTLIASDTAKTTTGTWTSYSFTLTSAQAAAITDYSDLRLRFTTTLSGGTTANRRGGAVSWAELEVPDIPLTGQLVEVPYTSVSATAQINADGTVSLINDTANAVAYTSTKLKNAGDFIDFTVNGIANYWYYPQINLPGFGSPYVFISGTNADCYNSDDSLTGSVTIAADSVIRFEVVDLNGTKVLNFIHNPNSTNTQIGTPNLKNTVTTETGNMTLGIGNAVATSYKFLKFKYYDATPPPATANGGFFGLM